jgi:hypothetical protein
MEPIDSRLRRPLPTAVLSFLVTLLIWTVFTWPLPRYVMTGIPSTAREPDARPARVMASGDHLQLLYHFRLFHHMLAGKIPPMHNVYEFNLGNDEDRFEPGAYYLPSSLFYAVGASLAGEAFGYNLSAFMSFWLAYLFTVLLVRRYTGHFIAWSAALFSIILPYPWLAQLGGSPSGFALPWVPLLMLGLDRALRDARVSGGLLAGLAILLASWNDTHVFFFCALLAPAWSVFVLLTEPDFRWREPRTWGRLAIALLPTFILGAVAIAFSMIMSNLIAGSQMAKGRSIPEVALFSPNRSGLTCRQNQGHHNQVYFGFVVFCTIVAGVFSLLAGALRRRTGAARALVTALLVCVGIGGVVALALGPYGPFEGCVFLAARKLIPPYRMIRQAGKVYCLMPALLALASALALTAMVRARCLKKVAPALVVVVMLLALVEYRTVTRAGVTVFPPRQSAYSAVARYAGLLGRTPRCLVITLWPSDSHYTSTYQHWAAHYGIRMINGYSAIVSDRYYNDVFKRFESANLGVLDDGQLDQLLGQGVHYVLLHEDLFPEPVSPFPVGFTLRNLLAHPRLTLLAQDGPVWAFAIQAEAVKTGIDLPRWDIYPCARRYEAERCQTGDVEIISDPETGGGGYLAMREATSSVLTPFSQVSPQPRLRYLLRVKGQGRLAAQVRTETTHAVPVLLTINSGEWKWVDVPVTITDEEWINLTLRGRGGSVEVDVILLTGGTLPAPEVGETVELPAPSLFRAGYTDLERNAVVLRADYEPEAIVLYGPKLPLPKGRYNVQLTYTTDADDGLLLGELVGRSLGSGDDRRVPVVAGRPAILTFTQPANLPVDVGLEFLRTADMVVHSLVFTRVPDAPAPETGPSHD